MDLLSNTTIQISKVTTTQLKYYFKACLIVDVIMKLYLIISYCYQFVGIHCKKYKFKSSDMSKIAK